MSLLKLYAAISLDGYIARENGDVAWLSDIPNPDSTDYGYADFYASIGTGGDGPVAIARTPGLLQWSHYASL